MLIHSTIINVKHNLVFGEVLILFQDLTQYEIYFNFKNYINGKIIGRKMVFEAFMFVRQNDFQLQCRK